MQHNDETPGEPAVDNPQTSLLGGWVQRGVQEREQGGANPDHRRRGLHRLLASLLHGLYQRAVPAQGQHLCHGHEPVDMARYAQRTSHVVVELKQSSQVFSNF